MSQPAHAPFHLTHLIAPALDSILHAVADRGDPNEANKQVRADGYQTLILSFQPTDAIDLQLAAQTVMFNEVLADSAHRVLNGIADENLQARTISGLISMGRLMQGHVDRLAKRGNKPFRTEIAAPQPETSPQPKPAEPPKPRATAAAQSQPSGPPEATPPRHEKQPETSRQDAPHEQRRLETLADVAARATATQVAAQAANLPPPPKQPRNGAAEAAPPHQLDQVRALMEAAGTLSRMSS